MSPINKPTYPKTVARVQAPRNRLNISQSERTKTIIYSRPPPFLYGALPHTPFIQQSYPANMTEGDLKFSKHMDVLIADNVYFGISSKLRQISPPSVQPFSSKIKRILI